MASQRKRRPTIYQAKKTILSLSEDNQDRSIIELCQDLPENRNGFNRREYVCRTILDDYFDSLPAQEQKELVLHLRDRLPFDEYTAVEREDELELREQAEKIVLSLSSDGRKQVRQLLDLLDPPDAEYITDAYTGLKIDEREKFLSGTTNYQDVLDRLNLLPSYEQEGIIFDVQLRIVPDRWARLEMNAAIYSMLTSDAGSEATLSSNDYYAAWGRVLASEVAELLVSTRDLSQAEWEQVAGPVVEQMLTNLTSEKMNARESHLVIDEAQRDRESTNSQSLSVESDSSVAEEPDRGVLGSKPDATLAEALSQEQRDEILFEHLQRQLFEFAEGIVPFLEDVERLPVNLNNKLEDELEQVATWVLGWMYRREGKNASDGTLPKRFKFDFTFCQYLHLRLGYSREELATILGDYCIVSDYAMREGRGLTRYLKRYGPELVKEGQHISPDNIQIVVLPEDMDLTAYNGLSVDEQARFWLRSWAHFVIEKHKGLEWWLGYWDSLIAQIPTMIDYVQHSLPDKVALLLEQVVKAAKVKAEYGDKVHPAVYDWLVLHPVDFQVLPDDVQAQVKVIKAGRPSGPAFDRDKQAFIERLNEAYAFLWERYDQRPSQIDTAEQMGYKLSTFKRRLASFGVSWPPQ